MQHRQFEMHLRSKFSGSGGCLYSDDGDSHIEHVIFGSNVEAGVGGGGMMINYLHFCELIHFSKKRRSGYDRAVRCPNFSLPVRQQHSNRGWCTVEQRNELCEDGFLHV